MSDGIGHKTGSNDKGMKLDIVDVRRAYFYAKAVRNVFVKLAPEDTGPGEEEMCGELVYSMYGTRDAALNWQREFTSTREPGLRHRPRLAVPL